MNFCKSLSFVLFLFLLGVVFSGNAFSQGRERILQSPPPNSQQQIAHLIENTDNQDLPEKYQRPQTTLTNRIVIASEYQPLVKKIVSSQPVNSATAAPYANNYAGRNSYGVLFSAKILGSILTKVGKPYIFGSSGPSSYDCSGFVWSVFQEAGFYFERSNVRTIWQNAEPVQGEDRFKPGTLVFLNGLAHIGIVADENGFFHASTSHGVMYSRFDGYWQNRIVGFRRMRINNPVAQVQ